MRDGGGWNEIEVRFFAAGETIGHHPEDGEPRPAWDPRAQLWAAAPSPFDRWRPRWAGARWQLGVARDSAGRWITWRAHLLQLRLAVELQPRP